MTKAHGIFRSAGFRDVNAPDDFPDALKSVVVFMELAMEAQPGKGRFDAH